jgi:chitinase
MKDWGFDGIDIDWEYPSDDTQAANFVLLLQAVRNALDSHAATYAPGYHFLLTVASPAGPTNYNILHQKDMDAYLDAWNMMAYDYSGAWDSNTGHQANLYPSSSNPNSTPFSTDRAVSDYIAAGIPANKIVMGMPIYGRAFESTSMPIGGSYSGVGSGSWENGIWDFKSLPKSGATEYYDAESGASYSFDASIGEFITYDTLESVGYKVDYLKNKGIGGAMFWEASADKTGAESLIGAVAGGMGGLDASLNWLSYPASQYANVVAGMPGE